MGIGLFLLGLGAGTGVCSLFPEKRPLLKLFKVETFLSALAFVVGSAAYGVGFLNLIPAEGAAGSATVYLAVGAMIFLIGFLSGYEFPMLLQSQAAGASYSIALGVSYFGGLFAGIAVPFFLNPGWGPLLSLIYLGLLNFTLAVFLLGMSEERAIFKPASLAYLLVPTAFLCAGVFTFHRMEQAYLKTTYFAMRIPEVTFESVKSLLVTLDQIPEVERHHSPYQKIDLVRSSSKSAWAMDPNDGVTLYLDRRLQFTEATIHLYHESMIHGAFNLSRRIPRRVLILGGGDGLLADELLHFPEVERIDLVELDPLMIQLAKNHPDFLRLNGGSLFQEKVRVHINDAFRYLKTIPAGSVDAVFVDFPYPHSPDLLRLYSIEFYEILNRAMSESAFAVMDGPIYTEKEMAERGIVVPPQWVIARTLKAAGFPHVFTFGPYEGFYYFTKTESSPRFDYRTVSPKVSNAALVNMKETNYLLKGAETLDGAVNSLFRPYPVMPPSP
ncbi:MAG TPA: hypothetical protein PL182_08830 [Pseudobdellovibrionaceae bacterium]|nr:hypothetical protein [Pseudobdellovibrionaceae bacterium]